MNAPVARTAQVFRKATQAGVVFFIAWGAASTVWRNYKLAHNSDRLVELMHGPLLARLYDWNDRVFSSFGDGLAASNGVLGMTWAANVGPVATMDPVLALSLAIERPRDALTFLTMALLPLVVAAVFGKVFCSHLCPARFLFEVGQAVRRGLERVGLPLPDLRVRTRVGPYVLVGGVIGAALGGTAIWFFVLPYLSLAGALILAFTGGPALTLALVGAAFVLVDALVAPGAFCHAVCPTGALLELVGRYAPFKLQKSSSSSCPESCRVCTDVCPFALSPREETHTPACNACGACVVSCPKKLLARRFARPARARALPIVTSLTLLLVATTASAHHNKGLPHYGYFENYPQVPTEEYVYIERGWEIGATVFNFQGLERTNAETPNDVKIYLYLYDLKADRAYTGPIDFEIRHDGATVSTFTREKDDGEATYATRETLPTSGAYVLVARPRSHPGVVVSLPFDIDLAADRVRWGLVAALLLPAVLALALAVSGRSRLRRRRARNGASLAAASALALTLAGSGARATEDGAHATMDHATMDHAAMDHAAMGHAAMDHAGMEHPSSDHPSMDHAGMEHPSSDHPSMDHAAMDHATKDHAAMDHATMDHAAMGHAGMEHPSSDHPSMDHATMDHAAMGHTGMDHASHTMTHYTTDDGGQVMVMGGIPAWLFLLGVALVILLSFVAVELVGARPKSAWRFNLAKDKRVYRLLRSRWFQAIPQAALVVVLAFLVYAGLFGSGAQNITPIAVWTIWWGGLVFAVALFGPVFCFACPWDGLANLASRLRAVARVEPISLGLAFPSWLANLYPAITLFVLLTWLELGFGVTTSPRSTAYMGLGMASLAVVAALLFDGKRFCHHGCPVGRISGIYANVSPIEIRAKNPKTCAACKTEDCKTGNARGYPCPTGISLKVIEDATYCTMCTECIKSCDKQNIAVNLRPFGADLDAPRTGRLDEAWLSLSLLALTLFHGLSMTPAWESFAPGGTSLMRSMSSTFGTPKTLNFTLGMFVLMAIPVGLYALSVWLGARLTRGVRTTRELFVQYAYSLLPVALFYHLAHNSMHVLMEGGAIVPRLSDPLGTGANVFGTRDWYVGPLLSEDATWVLQVALILVGHVVGIVVAHRISRRLFPERALATRSLIPMLAVMIFISVCGLGLMHLDMNMRVGRM